MPDLPPEEDNAPPTEGYNSTGIRMIGLNSTHSEQDDEGIDRGRRPARPTMEFYMEDNLEAEYAPEKETPPEEAPEAGSDAQIDRGYGQKPRAADEKKRGKKKKGHPVLRTILVWTVSVILLGIIGIVVPHDVPRFFPVDAAGKRHFLCRHPGADVVLRHRAKHFGLLLHGAPALELGGGV